MSLDLVLRIPQGVLSLSALFATLPLDKAYVGYQAIQAACKTMETSHPRLFFLMEKAKAVFIAIDFAALFWGVGKIAMALDNKFSIISGPHSYLVGLGGYGVAFAWIIVGMGAVYAINQLMKSLRDPKKLLADTPDPEEKIENAEEIQKNVDLDVDYDPPFEVMYDQFMAVTRIVVNIALAFFVPEALYLPFPPLCKPLV